MSSVGQCAQLTRINAAGLHTLTSGYALQLSLFMLIGVIEGTPLHKAPTPNRLFGQVNDGGVQDDLQQMTDQEILEFSTALEGGSYTDDEDEE